VNRARQAFINNGVSLSDFLPPTLNAAPGPTTETAGHIVPLYDYAAAPMGISTFGLENTSGTTVPYILNTTSLLGTFSTNDPEGLQVLSPYYGSLQSYGDQLNTVLNNTTILGAGGYDFWLQNVIQYSTATNTLSFENNIWNFSSPSGIFPSNSILHGLGRVEESEVYEEGGPSMTISYPFTLDLYLNTTVGSYLGSPFVNEVYFNYTVINSAGKVVCPVTEPTGETCGMYDNVYFNSATPGHPNVNVAPGSAEISANGYQYTPLGLPSDMEMDVGIGQSDGANANVVYSNATVGLYTLNATTHQYQAPPSAYNFGSETGETGAGALTTWNMVNGQPIAYLRTGPSLLTGLWNVTGGTTGAPSIGAGTQGALALNYAGVSPGNAFIAIAPGLGVTNQSFFQVAPTFGWFSGKGEIGQNIWLSPGLYTVEVMLSGYYEVSLNIWLHYAGQPLAVTLSRSEDPTVYTPLWAYSASDLANLSTSGAGTLASPYVLPGSQTGSLAPVFAILNDYLFIVYSGVWINATTSYFEFNPAPSLEITEPSWWYFQLESLAASYGPTPTQNQLPMYFYHTSNFVVEHGADIGLWSSDIEVGHNYAVYCNVCTNSLFAENYFNVSSEGLDFLGTGTAPNSGIGNNYVWGNTFNPYPVALQPHSIIGGVSTTGVSAPSTGLAVTQSGDRIYNNAFYTNGTASSSASGRGGSGLTYTNFWNATGGYQPATNSITVNGVVLTGSILGQTIQGGNFWFNYGTVADPYGLPYVARASSPTGTAAIAVTGDLAPLSTYMNVALASKVPTALGVGLYSVTFTESGLATGNSWTMRIMGVPVYEPISLTTLRTNPTNTTVVSVSLKTNILWVPNGTYAWNVAASPTGLAALGGTITVNGASVALTVTFKTAPVASLSPGTATTQVGGSVTYTASVANGVSPITWTLQTNQPGSPSNLSADAFTATASGLWTVYLNATDGVGRTSHVTATVTVEPALVATLSPTTATTQVGGSVVYTVGWTGGVAPVTYTLQSNELGALSGNTFTAITPGTYTVYLNASDAVGSVSDVTATVTVEPPLVATLSPGTATTQVGGSVTYTVGLSGGVAPISYTLQSNETGALSGTTFTAISPGTYTVYLNATDAVGSVSDVTATVTVEPALVATLSPGTATTQVGGSVAYTVGLSGGVAPVTWTLQSNQPGSPSNLTGATFVALQAGTWTVYLNATDAVGSVSDLTAMVTVEPALVATLSPATATTQVGGSVTYTVGWTGGVAPVSYTLQSNELGALSGNTFTAIAPGTWTVYLNATDAVGSVSDLTATVTVEPALVAALSPGTAAIYVGGSVAYTVGLSGGVAPVTYTLQSNQPGSPSNLSGDSFTGTHVGTWTVYLNATDAVGSVSDLTATVTVSPVPTFSVTFKESGLPSGLKWKVSVNGVTKSLTTNGGTDSLTWTGLPDGTYAYSVSGIAGWHQSTLPYSGSVVVSGASVTEPTLVYTEVTYSVTFSETGLPAGLTWQVTVNGVTQSLTTVAGTNSLTWTGLLNGTYSYLIAGNAGWHQSSRPYSGTVKVTGSSVTEAVHYTKATYSVTFSESGLPAGLKFKVTVDGVTKTLTTDGGTDSLTWTGLVNNTYAYSISGVPGYHQSTLPPSGTVVVAGTSVTEPTIVYT
jgi:thermopsin